MPLVSQCSQGKNETDMSLAQTQSTEICAPRHLNRSSAPGSCGFRSGRVPPYLASQLDWPTGLVVPHFNVDASFSLPLAGWAQSISEAPWKGPEEDGFAKVEPSLSTGSAPQWHKPSSSSQQV